MTRVSLLSLLYVALLAFTVLASYDFATDGQGFAAPVMGQAFYCANLQSSGSDDQVSTIVFLLCLLPILFRLMRFWKSPSNLEVIFALGLHLILYASLLLMVECGDVLYTAFAIGDGRLASLVVLPPLSVLVMLLARTRVMLPKD